MFCGKDFVTLGRHSWRCKQRVDQAEQGRINSVKWQVHVIHSPGPVANSNVIKCCCGKLCKGNRGLKMHQRSCRVVHGLGDELRQDLQEELLQDTDSHTTAEVHTEDALNDTPGLKEGINLPKSDSEWSTANDYFKMVLQLNAPIRPQDLNSNIKLLNDVIYNYFATNFGKVQKADNKNLAVKYKDFTVKELKKSLKELKNSNGNIEEIKYVLRALRDKLNTKRQTLAQDNGDDRFNHDKYISKNFWGYVKSVLNRKDALFPSFSMAQCTSYFKKTLASINPNKLFHIPSWIPKLSEPEEPFDLEPPTYKQVTNVIRKMKASGCPCPLYQISIICFKRCPYLHTYLHEIISTVWSSGTIPTEWKRACTILIHKKGSTDNPVNFRPITLESIPLKVFTSCLRNSIFPFLAVNKFIENDIQKGFTPNLSGTLEHCTDGQYHQ